MEGENHEVTLIDVTTLTPGAGNNVVSQEASTVAQLREYRHVLQTEGSTSFMCSVCYKLWPSLVEFNMHVCLVETLLQPANVVIITSSADTHTSTVAESTCDLTTLETTPAAEVLPMADKAAEPVESEAVRAEPVDAAPKTTATTKGTQAKADSKDNGKILPILLPDFETVKADIEKRGLTQCEVCGSEFKTSAALVNHMKKHTGGGLYRCQQCPSVFTTEESLRRHSKKHSQNSPTECSVCKVVFESPDSCTAHMRTHAGKKVHTCGHCNKVFAYRKDYNVHMRTHTGERPYSCDECQASFSQKGHLSRHMRMHSGERPHVCDECGATFSIRYRLVEHWRIHTKERPYVCSLCGAAFAHLNTLKFHKRQHSGEKPYCCDHCGARFSHQTHLVVHKRRHTGDRPYKCEECDASYTRKNLLVIHKRKHTGERPFKCSYCSAAFAQNSYLKDHLRIHTGEKPFVCDMCGLRFSQRTSLRLHRKNHFNPQPKRSQRSRTKEGNMLDRMISDLGRNKQRRTRQAKEALKKEQQEEANLQSRSLLLGSGRQGKGRAEEEVKATPDFVVVGLAKVEETGMTEAEASALDNTLLKPNNSLAASSSAAHAPASGGRGKKGGKSGSPIKLKLIVAPSSSAHRHQAEVDRHSDVADS